MERPEVKGIVPESSRGSSELDVKPKSHFNLRVNKKLFTIALLICLVLIIGHIRTVNRLNFESSRRMGWHLEQLAIELSILENSLLEQVEINETDLRLLSVASQVVSWEFKNHPYAFHFGAEDCYHKMHAILRLRQKQGLTDEDQRAVQAFTGILAEMREHLMEMAEQAYLGKGSRLDLNSVIELSRELDYTAWHFVEHDRLPGDLILSDQEMENKIRALPGWKNAPITITPLQWQSTEFFSGYNRAEVEIDGDVVRIDYSAYTGDIRHLSVPYFADSMDAESTVKELVHNILGPDFSVPMLTHRVQEWYSVTYHYKGVEIACKEEDHCSVSIGYPGIDNRLILWNIPPTASISEAELTPQLTMAQAREILDETEDPVELPLLHYGKPSEDGLVLLISARSGRYVLAYKFKSRGYVNAVTGEREVPYSNYHFDRRIFGNSPVGHLGR
ncbi:MAG: hypothetical protein ACOX2G_11195 [Bacillota bacterium]